MEIEPKIVNRYLSITGDKVVDDRKGLVAKAKLKLMTDKSISTWARKRLKLFVKELEE